MAQMLSDQYCKMWSTPVTNLTRDDLQDYFNCHPDPLGVCGNRGRRGGASPKNTLISSSSFEDGNCCHYDCYSCKSQLQGACGNKEGRGGAPPKAAPTTPVSSFNVNENENDYNSLNSVEISYNRIKDALKKCQAPLLLELMASQLTA